MQPFLGDIDLIAENQLERLRQSPDDRGVLSEARRRDCPRFIFVVLWRQPHAKNTTASFGFLDDPLDLRAADSADGREKRPLVGPGNEVAIEKDTVVLPTRSLLQRQGDQVAEPSLRHRVLIGKETIVGIQSNVGPRVHRLRKDVRSKPSGQGRWNGCLEEEPDMRSSAGARAFDSGWKIQAPAGLEKSRNIVAPPRFVEINSEEEAGLVLQQRIDAGDKWLSAGVMAGQMPANHVVGHRQEAAVGTLSALDTRFLADTTHPFVRTSGRIPGLPGLPTLESTGVHVFASPKQGPEESDLGLR